MSSQLSLDGDHIQPGDRVVDLERRVDTDTPDDPLGSLGVFIRRLNPRSLVQLTDVDSPAALPLIITEDSSDPGVIVRWRALSECRLLEYREDPELLAVSVVEHQIPITIRPLSRLRSAEGALDAAEEIGMVPGEAIRPLVDSQVPSPPLERIAAWFGAWDYPVEYDAETKTFRVERGGQTCAIFSDGSVVGEHELRADLEALLDQMP